MIVQTDDSGSVFPIISFKNVSVVRNGKPLLSNINWTLYSNESWAITGPNGSGKSLLTNLILGKLPLSNGEIIFSDESIVTRISAVSFELQSNILNAQQNHEWSREFGGYREKATTVGDFLGLQRPFFSDSGKYEKIIKLMSLDLLLDSTLLTLSNGEMRKAIIARALLSSPRILILDEPFDGLDLVSKQHLSEIIGSLIDAGTQIIIVTFHADEIPRAISYCLCLKNGSIAFMGKKDEMKNVFGAASANPQPQASSFAKPSIKIENKHNIKNSGASIIMKDVTVSYSEKIVLDNLNWIAHQNEDWAIVGPNGAGKTTLLRLISADHPQVYANDIWLFGRKRGSGESIWDIKEKIGLLSPELQLAYNVRLDVMEIVLSGFFDSIGLFRRTTPEQHERAVYWLDFLGMSELENSRFDVLSYGQKRMVLLARALVKMPELLILDEPCQGLDSEHSRHILDSVSEISGNTATQVLFVTHRLEELPWCITHLLEFKKCENEPGKFEKFSAKSRKIR
jgi:molybdate transport system ATP-binding protein